VIQEFLRLLVRVTITIIIIATKSSHNQGLPLMAPLSAFPSTSTCVVSCAKVSDASVERKRNAKPAFADVKEPAMPLVFFITLLRFKSFFNGFG
jgi:hypothetical protein